MSKGKLNPNEHFVKCPVCSGEFKIKCGISDTLFKFGGWLNNVPPYPRKFYLKMLEVNRKKKQMSKS